MGPSAAGQSKRTIINFFIFAAALAIGFWTGLSVARERGFPFLTIRQTPWSIGIYGGKSPFKFVPIDGVKNPVLTAKDVTDVPALFVADPFMIQKDQTWYLFFEVMNRNTHQGDIGVARSTDGLHWAYERIVLDEPFHLSYPYVFQWGEDYYLMPESAEANSIRLYKADPFPMHWTLVTTLLKGIDYVDSSIVHYGNYWWLFTTPQWDQDTLHLYYSKELTGPWLLHPQSPIVRRDGHHARSGGRVIEFNGHLIRYAQDCVPTYGNQVHAFEILELTPTNYRERESKENPVVKSGGEDWAVTRMHQVDPHRISGNQWIACVDGYGTRWDFDLRN